MIAINFLDNMRSKVILGVLLGLPSTAAAAQNKWQVKIQKVDLGQKNPSVILKPPAIVPVDLGQSFVQTSLEVVGASQETGNKGLFVPDKGLATYQTVLPAARPASLRTIVLKR